MTTRRTKPNRRRALPCGGLLLPSGIVEGLPVGGPCSRCGHPMSEHGGHATESACGSLQLLCSACCGCGR